ncbi:MAG: MurR/RpiR family transcriptional regulator [Ilumatobacter sp.]|uniref:MurR/RpiR family transcriptional regulator n=1 Tax=Ilumatobacter sp. TaxID=1967498 RepID=UPI002626992C|nr:MurR/RpiR family transcriptional regulator [Ilumatobacter sp.]MDJ0770429.1 MurR/RpiR family transcriptional regulator [Ilumatobacter sp.]
MTLVEPTPSEPTEILGALSSVLDDLSPQVRQAAVYVLDNPGEIAVTSMRGIADAAGVKPNTLVRMARAVGFDGYDDLRTPFRQNAAEGTLSFPDRARFLQTISQGGSHGSLLADMAGAAFANVESLFASADADELRAAADLIDEARRANVLGVGTARTLAENFAYVASMAVDNVTAIPVIGLAIDDVARMDGRDVLVAMTFSPYRSEVVEAVRLAVERSVPVIVVTDSHASPIVPLSTHAFVVPNDSPLPFSSNIAATALLETLLAFVVAESHDDVATAIEAFHDNRRQANIYQD